MPAMLSTTSILSLAMLAIPSLVSAAPIFPGFPGFPGAPGSRPGFAVQLPSCPLTRAKLELPAGAAAANVSIPAGEKPVFVALGVGVQNYTCSGGVYGTNMAVATLFDASCSVGTPLYAKLPEMAVKVAPKPATLPPAITALIGQTKLGDHYFQKLSATAASASPVFDLRATKKGDFFAGAKLGSVASPAGAANAVAWLELNSVAGTMAKHAFRVQTAGGVAPASCTKEGEVKTVNYAAMYWFFK